MQPFRDILNFNRKRIATPDGLERAGPAIVEAVHIGKSKDAIWTDLTSARPIGGSPVSVRVGGRKLENTIGRTASHDRPDESFVAAAANSALIGAKEHIRGPASRAGIGRCPSDARVR